MRKCHNLIGFPKIQIVVNSFQTTFAYISPVYHVNLDKPDYTCESSLSYSFTACIKNSLSRMVGCRLPWDVWSSHTLQICSTLAQLLQFEELYEELDTWEKHSIVKLTGCHPPCQYTEYLMKSSEKRGQVPGLVLRLSQSIVEKKTEQTIYPIQSFVSEFGGALGLFLGFSFMMIWDLLASSVSYCLTKYHISYCEDMNIWYIVHN